MRCRSPWEYFRAIYARYRQAGRRVKRVILNEFCGNTGYHRKYAIRLLNGPLPERVWRRVRRRRSPSYSSMVVSVVGVVWEAAGYPWSVRLKALVPLWMPWVGKHFRASAEVERQLGRISARHVRRLRARKQQSKRRRYGRTRPGTLLKHHIPIKTDA